MHRTTRYRRMQADPVARTSPGALVLADLHAGAGRGGRHELESSESTVVWEQALAAPEDDRLDHEVELVDELFLDQLGREVRAAVTGDIATVFRLQLRDRSEGVIGGQEV